MIKTLIRRICMIALCLALPLSTITTTPVHAADPETIDVKGIIKFDFYNTSNELNGVLITALDNNGNPLEPAKTTTTKKMVVYDGYAATDGGFKLKNVPKDGKLRVEYGSDSWTMTEPRADSSTTLPLKKKGYFFTLDVTVKDSATDKAINGATVTVYKDYEKNPLIPNKTGKTKTNGKTTLSYIPPQGYIEVEYNGRTGFARVENATKPRTDSTSGSITVYLPASSTDATTPTTPDEGNINITGFVMDSKTRKPLANAQAIVYTQDQNPTDNVTTTGKDGYFYLYNVPRDSSIHVKYADKHLKNDKTTENMVFSLQLSKTIDLKNVVVLSQGGETLKGATVTALWYYDTNPNNLYELVPSATTTTDDKGEFTLLNIPEKCKIRATYDGKEKTELVKEGGKILTKIIIPLEETINVTGFVVDQDGGPIDAQIFALNKATGQPFVYKNTGETMETTSSQLSGKFVLSGVPVSATLLVRPLNDHINTHFDPKQHMFETIQADMGNIVFNQIVSNSLEVVNVSAEACDKDKLDAINAIATHYIGGKCLATECKDDKLYYISSERKCEECPACNADDSVICSVTSQDTFKGKTIPQKNKDEKSQDYEARLLDQGIDFTKRYECVYDTKCAEGYDPSTITNAGKYNAHCEAAGYEIVYHNIEEATLASNTPQTYIYKEGVKIQGIPTKPGHEFLGWCNNEALTGDCNMTPTIGADSTGNVEFWAKWSKCTECKYDPISTKCELSVVDNKCTYTTSCTDDKGYGPIQNNGNYNPVCPAKKFTITLHANGGRLDGPSQITYTYNVPVTVDVVPTNDPKYEFTGWCDDSAGTQNCNKIREFKAGTYDNKELWASWSECSNEQLKELYAVTGNLVNGQCVPTACFPAYKLNAQKCVLKHNIDDECNNTISKDDPDFLASGENAIQITKGQWKLIGDESQPEQQVWRCRAIMCADGFIPTNAGECVPDSHKPGDPCGTSVNKNDPDLPMNSHIKIGKWQKVNGKWVCIPDKDGCEEHFTFKEGRCVPLPAQSTYISQFTELGAIINNNFTDSSMWKNDEGNFNTTRLIADSTAGVVLGTIGGVVTSSIVKKNQLKSGLEKLKCTIGGQTIANYGDEFNVRLY